MIKTKKDREETYSLYLFVELLRYRCLLLDDGCTVHVSLTAERLFFTAFVIYFQAILVNAQVNQVVVNRFRSFFTQSVVTFSTTCFLICVSGDGENVFSFICLDGFSQELQVLLVLIGDFALAQAEED